jgi:hypothetical protein
MSWKACEPAWQREWRCITSASGSTSNSVVLAWPLLTCWDGDLKTHTKRLSTIYAVVNSNRSVTPSANRARNRTSEVMVFCTLKPRRLCMASAFCVYEALVDSYGKHLANSKRSTPLSESRARNLSSPVFVF